MDRPIGGELRSSATAWSRGAAALLALGLLAGCATGAERSTRLERVAKDWSAVIRASQIIPVYPPTEDLQPGDLFLVQTTVDRQHQLYRERGYLPLDYHIGRLPQPDYAAFYRQAFSAPAQLPRDWRESGWAQAPVAAFPSYSFEVSRSAGLELALPISGVSVGLSLLGSNEAFGTVTIADAHTYGVDVQSLGRVVETWSQEAASRRLLASFAGDPEKPNYLRAISRVYLASAVDVVIADRARRGAELEGRLSSPAALLTAPDHAASDEASAYTRRIADINEQLRRATDTVAGAAPALPAVSDDVALPAPSGIVPLPVGAPAIGGRLQLMAGSAQTVALRERFARPLVIGYLAFDMRIGEGGRLGPPIATHVVLAERVEPDAGFSDEQIDYRRRLDALLRTGDPERYARVLARIDRNTELLFNSYRAHNLDAQTLGERLGRLLFNHVRSAADEPAARRKILAAIDAELPDREENNDGPVRRSPDRFR